MGINKIIHGNCLDVLKDFKDNCVDLVLTSPPYNMRTRIRNGEYTERETAEHFSKKYKHFDDAIPIEDFYEFHKKVLMHLLRVSNIVVYNIQIVTGSKEAFFKIIGDFAQQIKDIIIWDKGAGQPAMHDKVLNSCYEMLIIFENDKKGGRLIQNAYFERGMLSNLWRISREKKETDDVNAVFPIRLAVEVIKNFSPLNGVVLDPFMGTGTTAIAALKMDMRYLGIEIELEHVKIAEKRISEYHKQGKMF